MHLVLGPRDAAPVRALLAIGLGNPLMGDEGIGWHLAEWLKQDPRTPSTFEVIQGGTDLLRLGGQMGERTRVVVIDALQDSMEPGTVTVFDGDFAGLDERQAHTHHLSAVQAIRLLQMETQAAFTLITISIRSAASGLVLSDEVERRIPEILGRVIEELTRLPG